MTKLKHIAIATPDPEKTAEFFKNVFDLQEVGRVDNDNAVGYYLSDGSINLAVLNFRNSVVAGSEFGTGYAGIHHIGFTVEDIPNFVKRAEKAGGIRLTSQPEPGVEAPARGHSNADVKFSGPDGVIFDMSQYGWIGN